MNCIKPITNLSDIYRPFNIGATTLVSTSSDGKTDVMAAAWACALNYDMVSVVIDSTHYSRPLIERGKYFALQLPLAQIADKVMYLGSVSKNDDPEKLEKSGAEFFTVPGFEDLPLVKGCGVWVIFERVPEQHVEKAYDLFIGKAVAAWADSRIYDNNHWLFEKAPDALSTLHYVAGGHFYTMGKPIDVKGYDE
ncbi:MAG: flavin reductase [Sutterellaceae bacterium]|nr:flavin reductase [Sutterellaceae bacterium]MDY2867873.1 flavin reductase [Mesosutterella sp.]